MVEMRRRMQVYLQENGGYRMKLKLAAYIRNKNIHAFVLNLENKYSILLL